MRIILPILAAVVLVLLVGIPALRRLLASDETLIRWRIAEAIADFDEGRVRAVEVLAPDFVDETSGVDRDAIRAAIAYATMQRRTSDGEFGYRLEVPGGDAAIAVTVAEGGGKAGGSGGGKASATLPLRLFDLRRTPPDPVWELRVEGDLQHGADGWQLTRVRHTTVAGARPR